MPVKDAVANSASRVYVAMVNLENKMKKSIANNVHLTCTVNAFTENTIYKRWILVVNQIKTLLSFCFSHLLGRKCNENFS